MNIKYKSNQNLVERRHEQEDTEGTMLYLYKGIYYGADRRV